MADPAETVRSVNASLDELESTLDALFAKSLAETEENLAPEQKAKLQVLLSYVIQDMVLIFLKTKGLDPSKHPVSEELKRVKAYFDKIKEAEDPAQRTLLVDRDAANRFIRAAISDATKNAPPPPPSASASSSSAAAAIPPVGRHTRFQHLHRSEAREERKEKEESEESDSGDDVVVYGESLPPPQSASASTSTGSGSGSAANGTSMSRKRANVMDPFQGYTGSSAKKSNSKGDESSKSKKRRKDKTS